MRRSIVTRPRTFFLSFPRLEKVELLYITNDSLQRTTICLLLSLDLVYFTSSLLRAITSNFAVPKAVASKKLLTVISVQIHLPQEKLQNHPLPVPLKNIFISGGCHSGDGLSLSTS